MTTMNKSYVVHYCLAELGRNDFACEEVTDYEGVISEMMALGKSYLTPNMSVYANDFTTENCIWFKLMHQEKLVGGIAARRDLLGSEVLGDFWRRTMRRQYGAGDADQIAMVSLGPDREISGSVTYFGDLYIGKGYRGWGTHLRCFTMLSQMIAALKWNSDWVYSFISEERATNVGPLYYGFSRAIPGAQVWFDPPKTRSNQEVFVYSSRADLEQIAAYYARSPEQLSIAQNGKRPGDADRE